MTSESATEADGATCLDHGTTSSFHFSAILSPPLVNVSGFASVPVIPTSGTFWIAGFESELLEAHLQIRDGQFLARCSGSTSLELVGRQPSGGFENRGWIDFRER
jgi:hypothetical protein